MKFLTIALLVFSTAAFANGPTYYENDGTAPELFKSKSNEVLNQDQAKDSKKIIRSTTTTVEQQEDAGTGAGTQTTEGSEKELKVTDENKHLMQNVPKKGMNVEKQEALGGEEPLDVGIPSPEESNKTP